MSRDAHELPYAMPMAAVAAGATLHFPYPKPPKWNPLTLLYLPVPSDSRTVSGAAAGSSCSAMAALSTGTTSLCFFP